MHQTNNWILLRGLTRESRHWGNFPVVMQQMLPQARIVTIDAPGTGQANTLTCSTNMSETIAYLRQQNPFGNESFALIGLSLGGMMAIAWAAQYPAEVASVTIINSSSRSLSAWYQRIQPQSIWPLLSQICMTNIEKREQSILRMTSTKYRDDHATAERWASYATSNPVSRMNLFRQLLTAMRFRLPAQLDVPLLVLASRGDALVAPECSKRLADYFKAPYREHPDAGHDLPLDQPEWVVTQLQEFILQTAK